MCVGHDVKQPVVWLESEPENLKADEVQKTYSPLPQRPPPTDMDVRLVRAMDDVAILKRVKEGLERLS